VVKIYFNMMTEGDKRWIKKHTEKQMKEYNKMKSSKKRYQVNTTEAIEFWNKMFSRMEILLKLIDVCKPNRDIDDPEYRWVEDRIKYWKSTDRILDKNEMLTANLYWKKFNGPHNVVSDWRNG
tara:strand:- start:33 stop:401 length:369 start_codon:yes stop_codon:yes gene_type:complete